MMIEELKALHACEKAAFEEAVGSPAQWTSLVSGGPLVTTEPAVLGGAIEFDQIFASFKPKRFLLPSAGYMTVEDCDVVGYGLVAKAGNLLVDRNLTMPLVELGQHGYYSDVDSGSDGIIMFGDNYRRIAPLGDAVLLLRRGDVVHGHWLLEVLPRVLSGLEASPSAHFIVSSDIRPYQINMLEALGVPKSQIVKIERNEVIRCERLHVPSVAHTNQLWIHPFSNKTFDRLITYSLSSRPVGKERGKKIFVTRTTRLRDPRPLLNARDIESVAREEGYAIVDPGAIDWIDQVRIFYEAEVVVGLSGSGLHNTVFTGSRAHVITLQPNQNFNYLQVAIATLRGHKVSYLFGDSLSGFDSKSWETPYIIDKRLLRIILRHVVQP